MRQPRTARLAVIPLALCLDGWEGPVKDADVNAWFAWGISLPAKEGYAVSGADGRLIETLTFPHTVGFLDPTPDRSGYFRDHVILAGMETSISVTLSVKGHEISRPSRDGTKVVWTSGDGSSFFLQEGSDLAFWSLCSGKSQTEVIAREVGVWAVSGDYLFLTSMDDRRQLTRRALFGTEPSISVELPVEVDQILPSNRPGSVLVSESTQGNPARLSFWRVNLETHDVTPISVPDGAWAMEAYPAVGTTTLLLEVWGHQATYLDGVPITDFALWDYQANSLRTLFRNPHGLRPFAGPKNHVEVGPRCRPASATASGP